MVSRTPQVAIIYSDEAGIREATPENSRYAAVCEEFRRRGVQAEPTPYHDEAADEVRRQLIGMDGVLVWVNPIAAGRSRAVLDQMLREVASGGVFVSAHPDVILKMGTKDVLVQTQDMPWSSGDIHVHRTVDDMRGQLPAQLAAGASRVLKQHRGNGGDGVWRVALADPGATPVADPMIRVLHARRGSPVQEMPLSDFVATCASYFDGQGHVINQPFQSPVPGGMVRCYMTHAEVVGFGHQHVTALCWSEDGAAPPPPDPRLYYPPSEPEFQSLKARMEAEWIPRLHRVLDVPTESLPVIWDADFLCRPPDPAGEADYALCEINVSCVSPFPDAALPRLVDATVRRIQDRR